MVFRVSLKTVPNPILLHDGPKKMRVLKPRLGVAEGEKAGSRKSLIYASLKQAWVYSWPLLV